MAYNLISEFAAEPDWVLLHSELMSRRRLVELFPVPASGKQGAPSLGISVPIKACGPDAWVELKAIVTTLMRFGGVVTELYSSRRLTPETLDALREMVMR